MCLNIVQDRIKKSFEIAGQKLCKIFINKKENNDESSEDLPTERLFTLSNKIDLFSEKSSKKIKFYLHSKKN